MANQIQILRRVGACENKQAQPDWKGPAIDPCPATAVFLCETCGRLLCGGHAGGHFHSTADPRVLASHFQQEANAAQASVAQAAQNAAKLQEQLTAAQADSARVAKIRELLG